VIEAAYKNALSILNRVNSFVVISSVSIMILFMAFYVVDKKWV
jgi:hypothetical protein